MSEILKWILIVLLVMMVVGAMPAWPHSRRWGYGPSGGLAVLLVVILLLFFLIL